MKAVVWLASYPRSGNTWLRFLLANYLSGSSDAVRVAGIRLGTVASARKLLDEWTGIQTSDLSADEVDGLRPDVYRAIANDARQPVFLKVHEAWRTNALGESLFPIDATLACVYAVRHPFDVAVSLAHFYGISLDEAAVCLNNRNLTIASMEDGATPQLPQRLGAWSDHVASWLEASDLDVTIIRYEDLRSDTERELVRVLRAIAVVPDPSRVRHAVAMSAFDRLQTDERESGFRGARLETRSGFFRSGKVGEGLRSLSKRARGEIAASQRVWMARLGYGADPAQDV